LLAYAQAKRAFDAADDSKDLEYWKGSKLMDAVEINTFALHKERIAKRNT